MDDIVVTSSPLSYWQSKLNVAQELSEFAIFIHSIPVTEAAVERTFSVQKILDTPIRNALSEKVVQAALFVRFNFLNFGDENLIPPSLREPVKYLYNQDVVDEDAPEVQDEATALTFWQL